MLDKRDGTPEVNDGRLDVADLVRMFEESEDATYEARQLSERDRDYVDNKQLTSAEEAALKKTRSTARCHQQD